MRNNINCVKFNNHVLKMNSPFLANECTNKLIVLFTHTVLEIKRSYALFLGWGSPTVRFL